MSQPIKFSPVTRCNSMLRKSHSFLVSYYWFCWRVYHGGVVDGRKVTINQLKVVFTQ